jgi:hypothetical protein
MRTLLLLPFILIFALPAQGQNTTGSTADASSVTVLSFKWFKSRQTIKNPDPGSNTPAASAMIPANRNFERNRRINDQAGVRDPNADTLDGRNAALEKSVQEARTPKSTPVNGFAYQAKVQNAGTKVIEVLFWEYQSIDTSNPASVTRRQFLCGVNIKPGKEKELQVFSVSRPSDVISVDTLANKSENLFQEKAVINRVEYSDGTIWQRKDWNFEEVKSSVARALSTPWVGEMCRSL